jgi:cysteine desulfurase
MKNSKTIYLDNAASTQMDSLVLKAMEPYLKTFYGNPSALYEQGRQAKKAIEQARLKIAKLINSKTSEIIFTAGGTESNNLAILGLIRPLLERHNIKPHIITTAIEHHAVLEPCRELEKNGAKVTYLPVDKQGFIKLTDLKQAINKETVLVTVMYANNEIGSILPIAEIGKILKAENNHRRLKNLPEIIFHSDACQAAGYYDLNVQALGLDLMTVNASKIYGPKQTGFLFVRNGINLKPIVFGGGQENKLRSGTENVGNIVGMSKALEIAVSNRKSNFKTQITLREYFIKKIQNLIPNVFLNGPELGSSNRLPNNVNLEFKDVEGEALQIYLDAKGVSVGTGSACDSDSEEPSHVLLAIGKNTKQAKSSVRFTLSKYTRKKELDVVLKILVTTIKLLRQLKA